MLNYASEQNQPPVCPNCGATNYLSTGACWRCSQPLAPNAPASPTLTPQPDPTPTPPSERPTASNLTPNLTPAPGAPPARTGEKRISASTPAPPSTKHRDDFPPFVPPNPPPRPPQRTPPPKRLRPTPRTPEVTLPTSPTRACNHCGAALHPGALHCWKCGADTPSYTPEIRARQEQQDREREWLERQATRRTLTESDPPILPVSPQINVSSKLVRALGIALAISIALAIVNPLLGSLSSAIPAPINVVIAPFRFLSGVGSALAVPLFLAFIVAAIARSANQTRIE